MLVKPSLAALVVTATIAATSLFALARTSSLSSLRVWRAWAPSSQLSTMASTSAPPALGEFLRAAKSAILQADDLKPFTLCTGNVAGGASSQDSAQADGQTSTRSRRPSRTPTSHRTATRLGASCR